MKQKIVNFLKNLLLASLIVFIILAPFSKKAVKICFIIAFVLWVIINILEFNLSFYKHLIAKTSVNKQLLFFFIALTLSTLFSLDPYLSHGILLERCLGYILFFCLGSYIVNDMRNATILIGAIMFGGILIGVGGIWDHLHLGTELAFYLGPGRLQTAFKQSVSFARFMVLYIPLNCIILFFAKNKILRSGGLISLILLFPCIFFNAARAAWVAVIVAILMVSFVKKKRIALLLSIFSIILFLSPHMKEKAGTIFNPLTWGERIPLWKIAIRMFADHPIFGAGLGMQEKLLYKYWEPSVLFQEYRYWHVHNTYLEVLAEAGIIGLFTFLWIFIRFFKNAFKAVKNIAGEQQALVLGLIGAVISALIFALSASSITAGLQEPVMFWFLFGMAAGLITDRKGQFGAV